MKKIYTFILTGAAILALAACNKDLQIEDNSQINGPVYETLSVKVGSEATTKVTLDGTNDSKSVFEDGDQIAVWTTKNSGEFQDCTVSSGQITVDLTGGATREKYAVYYNGATTPTFDGTTLTITLPDTYDYDDVADDKNPVPMVAVNDASDATNDLVFYAVCGLARITVTGIPATANKLEVIFSHDVTGSFTVTGPGTSTPSISAAAKNSNYVVTINLIPGTDYTGAVINIPVPTGTISAYMTAKVDDKVLNSVPDVLYNWAADRASGKKTDPHFGVSMYSMRLAPGNLYTEGGTLKMAANYYEHIYKFGNNGDYANDVSYNPSNRTHFNYNETYLLMKEGSLAGPSPAYENRDSYESPAVTRNDISGAPGGNWRVPSLADWTAMTTGARPGATLNATVGTNPSSSSAGWKFIKVLVTNMEGKGTSGWDGATVTALAADATAPSTDYQAGLLIFPDNVEIDGTFTVLGTQNKTDACAYATTQITKTDLDDLIDAGCAFLPSVGRWSSSSFGLVGTFGCYWSSTSYTTTDGFMLYCFSDLVRPNTAYPKSTTFRPVRLVRDL